MAKSNGSKSAAPKVNAAVASAAPGEANGGLVFEAMPDDFELPTRQTGGEWDDHLMTIIGMSPKTVRVFASDNEQEAYSRAKSLRKAIDRAKVGERVTVATRKHDGKHTVFAMAA